jgi:FkbM family methyltransferase
MRLYDVELIEADDMVIFHQLRTGKPFESESMAEWSSIRDSAVVDVGSYTGLYAIRAALSGNQVFAFEPNPMVYDRLRENIKLNQVGDQVEVSKKAVSNKVDIVQLGVNSTKLSSGGSLEHRRERVFSVKTVILDQVLPDIPISAIKIDVEGHEASVLQGAISIIKKYRPVIITEALNEAGLSAQVGILIPLGYNYTKADEFNLIWKHND